MHAPAQAPLALYQDLPHHSRTGKRAYSLTQAILDMAKPENVGKSPALLGLEGETSQELARRSGRSPQGFFVPLDVFSSVERRDLSTTTGAGGIATLLQPVLDILRARTVLGLAGCSYLPDLRGGLAAIPVKSAVGTLTWVGEGVTPQATSPTITQQCQFTPKTVGAYTDISYLALRDQPSLEATIKDDLVTGIGVELDRVGLNGSGQNTQPLGFFQNVSIATVSFGTNGGKPTYALLCQMEQTIGIANGDRNPSWITSPQGRSALRRTFVNGTGSLPAWRDNKVLDWPAFTTTNAPSGDTKGSGTALTSLIIGSFEEVRIGMWGAVDVLVNPFQRSTNGMIRVSALLDVDIQYPRVGAFCKADDVDPS